MAINNDVSYFKSQSHFVNFIKMLLRENHGISDLRALDEHMIEFIYQNSVHEDNAFYLKTLDFWNPAMYLTYRIRFLDGKSHSDTIESIFEEFDSLIRRGFYCEDYNSHEFKLPERYTSSYERITHSEIIENDCYSQMCEQARKATYKKCGVYKLYDKQKELIYIGKSINLADRIISSVNERKAHYFSFIICKEQCHANILEPYLIAILDPPLNSEHKTDDVPSFEIPIPKESRLYKAKKDKYAK